MADDLNLERADHVADEADLMDRAARRHQRRGHRQEGIAGPNRVDDIFGESGNCVDDPAPLKRHAAVLALGHDDL